MDSSAVLLMARDAPAAAGSVLTASREKVVNFLKERSANEVRHSGGNLLDHLIGVEAILRRWDEPAAVQLAGLFHSIYGTESFRRAILSPHSRGEVRAIIGEEAEALAWLFGGLKVESLLQWVRSPDGTPSVQTRWSNEPVRMSRMHARSLVAIFAANWLEQLDRMRAKAKASRLDDMRVVAHFLGGSAQSDIEAAHGFDIAPLVIDRRAKIVGSPVEVWDDAVPKELQIRLSGLMDLNIWRYGWKASHEQTAYGFWHSHFGGDDGDASHANCEPDLIGRALMAPVLELWRMLQAGPLEGHVPTRVYANGHTFGGDGHLHRDHASPTHFTTIYYAHPDWRANWAGETVFFDEAQEHVVASVFPKPGRLAHFPGNILHAARSPGRECPALRSVIVFKSRLETTDQSQRGTSSHSAKIAR